jgi:hypothetical protein
VFLIWASFPINVVKTVFSLWVLHQVILHGCISDYSLTREEPSLTNICSLFSHRTSYFLESMTHVCDSFSAYLAHVTQSIVFINRSWMTPIQIVLVRIYTLIVLTHSLIQMTHLSYSFVTENYWNIYEYLYAYIFSYIQGPEAPGQIWKE